MRAQASLGAARGKREVIDVPERKPPDRRLDQLLHVRKQRLSRLERERNEARVEWRVLRQELADLKRSWRAARQRAYDEWAAARTAFYNMTITSGAFKAAKAAYERMKEEAARQRLACLEAATNCRAAGADFFEAKERVLQANKQQEKLGVLRDEIRALADAQNEA